MDLSAKVHAVATCNIVRVNTLEIDKQFQVTHAQRLVTQNGPTVLLTLRVEADNNVKLFLDTDIEAISGGTEH